jgi:DNA-binding transcriptional regulator WhiA
MTARRSATVALRGALLGFGIAHDPETIDQACKVRGDGSAAIDDLESVARQYGLDVEQQLVPVVIVTFYGRLPSRPTADMTPDSWG